MSDTQIDDLDKQIANLQAKKNELLNKTKQEALTATLLIIKRYGFTASELGFSVSIPIAKKDKDKSKVKDLVKSDKPKAPAKYANPANPQQTWAGGKGARPLWVQSHLAAGKNLEELLIK